MRKLFLTHFDAVFAMKRGEISELDAENALFFFAETPSALMLKAGLVPTWVLDLYEDLAQCLEDHDRLTDILRQAVLEGRALFQDVPEEEYGVWLNAFLVANGYEPIDMTSAAVTRPPTWSDLAETIREINLTLDAVA